MQRELHGAKILIVDDQEANVRLLQGMLNRAGYTNTIATSDPEEVFSLCATEQPDLLLLDLIMPFMNGFQVMKNIRPTIPAGGYLPILVLTADASPEIKQRALSSGATDFLTKPFDHTEVLLRIHNLLEMRFLHREVLEQKQKLEERVRERTLELEETQIEVLERLAWAAEYRDDDTGRHTQRIGHNSALLAQALELSVYQVVLIRRAAPLHDVGKIGIPEDVLLKPGKLTLAEFEVMKTHTLVGARILSGGKSNLIRMAHSIALTHHENWDGSGYPRKLRGEDIPIAGRIVSVADTFDALTHDRPYSVARNREEAIAEIERQSGHQFDPRVVQALLQIDLAVDLPTEPALSRTL